MEDFRKTSMSDNEKQKIVSRIAKLENEIINIYSLLNKYLEENIALRNKVLALEEKTVAPKVPASQKNITETNVPPLDDAKKDINVPAISVAHFTVSQPKAKASVFMNLKDTLSRSENMVKKMPQNTLPVPAQSSPAREHSETDTLKQDLLQRKIPPKPDIKPIMPPSSQKLPGVQQQSSSLVGKTPVIVSAKLFHEPKLRDIVYIKGGTFMMGTNSPEAFGYEKPSHKVILNYDFYTQRYPVTQEIWKEIMGELNSTFSGDRLPVESISWFDSILFCNFLSKKENYPFAYNETTGELLDSEGKETHDITKVVGYRLPTEAEWEYSARGGQNSKGYKYSGSNNPDDVSWYFENSNNITHPVGEKISNELGLFDMNGNVWEWCTDSYERYHTDIVTNPYIFTGETSNRVLRGGSWDYQDGIVSITGRGFSSPVICDRGIGFRIFKTA